MSRSPPESRSDPAYPTSESVPATVGLPRVSVFTFDLNGPAAEIILAVMAWAAKMERLAINERIAAARARLEAEGRPWGRPKRLTSAQEATVCADRAAGRTIREIAQARKVPKSTVARALRAPFVTVRRPHTAKIWPNRVLVPKI